MEGAVCNPALGFFFAFCFLFFPVSRPASALQCHKNAEAPARLARQLRNDGVDNAGYFWAALPGFMQPHNLLKQLSHPIITDSSHY